MAKKKYDLVVATGSYQAGGETKKRWKTVGSVFVGDDGKPFLMLDRTFNPAGVPVEDGRDSIIVSCFEPKEERQPAPAPSREIAF